MLKIMIAEDDLMIADAVEETLTEHGYEVCGIARTVEEGVRLGLLHHPDLAILDVRLAEQGRGTEIAFKLRSVFPMGVLFATGNSSDVMLSGSQGEACITKPYRDESLLRALEIVAGLRAGIKATPPFPRGFQLLPTDGGPDGARARA